MIPLYESILSSTKSGLNGIAETIYNKLLDGEQLTEKELRWTDTNVGVFKVDENQLIKLIRNLKYNDISLNWLDVSSITNMIGMFINSKLNVDISKWDVSKVKDMNSMFKYAEFNGDISKWDVSGVKDMSYMFSFSDFNGDISNWNVSNVRYMNFMFYKSKFNGDISKWNIKKQCSTFSMFINCPIKNEYKPKKPQDK